MSDIRLDEAQIRYVKDCVAVWLGTGDAKAFESGSRWPQSEDVLESPLLRRLLTGNETIAEGRYGFNEISRRKHLRPDEDHLEFVLGWISEWVSLWNKNQWMPPMLADAVHSQLLPRLLSGKPAFPKPPPKLSSAPCYDLAEGKPVEVYFRDYGHSVEVSQCHDFKWHNKADRILVHTISGELYQLTESTLQKYVPG